MTGSDGGTVALALGVGTGFTAHMLVSAAPETRLARNFARLVVRFSRGKFGQWAIEPCELRRVYPALTEDTVTGNGTEERGVTGGETARAEGARSVALAIP